MGRLFYMKMNEQFQTSKNSNPTVRISAKKKIILTMSRLIILQIYRPIIIPKNNNSEKKSTISTTYRKKIYNKNFNKKKRFQR